MIIMHISIISGRQAVLMLGSGDQQWMRSLLMRGRWVPQLKSSIRSRSRLAMVCFNENNVEDDDDYMDEHATGLTYGPEFFGIVDKDAGLLEATNAVNAIQVCKT